MGKKLNITKKLLLLFSILLIISISFMVNLWVTNDENEVFHRSVSGETVEIDAKNAIEEAIVILEKANYNPSGLSTTDRVESLSEKDFTVIDESLENHIRFNESDTVEYKTNVFQTLVTIAAVVEESNGSISTNSSVSWQLARVDSEIGIVYIPVDVFVGTGSFFSFEMVYIDGEWKLAPYSLMDSVRLSVSLQEYIDSNIDEEK